MVLIDRKQLEEQIKEAFKENPVCMGMLLRWIRRQKAVGAAPVVHGKWIPHKIEGYENMLSIAEDVCSVCGQDFLEIRETGCIWNYCPNCGAKMDGGAE